MTDQEIEDEERVQTEGRDWAGPREWANLAVAAAALILGVVSFWTTAQVSSLEDYLRSEIARDNGELNRLADRSAALEQDATQSAERLRQLRDTADELLLSSLRSQQELETANSEATSSRFRLFEADAMLEEREARLSQLAKQVEEQSDALDRIEISRFFSSARYYRIFQEQREQDFDSTNGASGEETLMMLANYRVGHDTGADRARILAIRERAPKICSFLESYSPRFPELVPIPKRPKPNGEPRINEKGETVYYYTPRELYDRTVAINEWQPKFSAAWDANTKRRELINEARDYLNESASYCICRAIATERFPPEAICPGQINRPQEPDL